MELITSPQNPKIKNIIKLLTKSRERKIQNLMVIEGAREFSLALAGDLSVDSVFVCRELFSNTGYPEVLELVPENKIYEISLSLFRKIAYRENSDGLIALAIPRYYSLKELKLPKNPFIIVLESVEKPGNLGAILRTADAAIADAVIICDPLTDLYNPNVIRSSVGCLFTVPTVVSTSEEVLEWLRLNKITSMAAELNAAEYYQNVDFTGSSAIVMGTEAEGLTPFWLGNADKRIKIPMRGKIDSLNVSVSTAILTFEAMRQRGFK